MKRPSSQHGPANGNGTARNGHAPEQVGQGSDESLMISAPGKVIVFGEHAVVYGKVTCYYMPYFQLS